MKNVFRAIVFLALCLLLTACGQVAQVTPSSDLSPTSTPIPSVTPSPSQLPTFIVIPTQTQAPSTFPTLIPTIDPTLVPDLLRNTFSIQTLEGINGHNIRKITGWDYGFRQYRCNGYEWLGSSHLLLYPRTGQRYETIGGGTGRGEDLSSQPVIINLESGNTWLPKVSRSTSVWNCNAIFWSQELGVIISPESSSTSYSYSDKNAVATYTFDGRDVSFFWGKLLDISPSGTKILVDNNTWIDLKSGKRVEFTWTKKFEEEQSVYFPHPLWSSDETQVYTCCYRYENARTGENYDFSYDDLSLDGEKLTGYLYTSYGEWVLDDTYLLIQWDVFYDTNPSFIPLFDPKAKTLRNLGALANIPTDLNGPPNCRETSASPDRKYVWAECYTGNYLINLVTFKSVAYPNYWVEDFYWSSDSKFAWMASSGLGNEPSSTQFQILSVSNKQLKPIPENPLYETLLWHPTEDVLAYLSEGKSALMLLDPQIMSVRKVILPTTFHSFVWSPNGDRIALVAKDGSLWQVNYPKLENLEQLTPPLPNVREVFWSPDGKSIAFISGSGIYIVDTVK